MWYLLFFRISLVLAFLFSAWRWGDWKNWEKYYPTILFVMVVNLFASFLTYHHALWNYTPDALVETQTVLELVNSFVMLPTTAFIYLSRFPSNNKFYQYSYMILWVVIYSGLEFTDHYVMRGIFYTNGWSWLTSTLFDCAMFAILRLHYLKPGWAWLISFFLTAIILVVFNFGSAEMK